VELQGERDFISAIMGAGDSMVVVLDAEHNIVRASRGFESILGYAESELIGKNMSSFFVSSDPWQELEQAETYWQAKEASMRLIAWSKTTRNSAHVLLTGTDVTERQRAEQERERFIRAEAARAEAEAWERRSKFLAEASNMLSGTLDYEKTLANIS